MSHIKTTSSRKLIKALERLGFAIVRQSGSHVIMKHPVKNTKTCIPQHSGDLKIWIFKSILKQTEISEEELKAIL